MHFDMMYNFRGQILSKIFPSHPAKWVTSRYARALVRKTVSLASITGKL